MTKQELKTILEEHAKYLKREGGKFADLDGADLSDADLSGANLDDANLRDANMKYANLRGVDLSYANLIDADLIGADLRGANIDFSALPLSCKGLDFSIDERQAKQLMYHVVSLMQHSSIDTSKVVKEHMFKWLEDSHLVTRHNLPKLKGVE